MQLDSHLRGKGMPYFSDNQARMIFGESADWIIRRGTMIGCSGEWELWACYGRQYHVNPNTQEVKPVE